MEDTSSVEKAIHHRESRNQNQKSQKKSNSPCGKMVLLSTKRFLHFLCFHFIKLKEIRLYNDPKNKEFLDQITSGKLPMELVRFGTEVALEMEDRREDDYEQNKVLANNELIPNKF